jgi:hypothetical protein
MSRCKPIAIAVGILVTACSADDVARPNSAPPDYARSSTSQGLTRTKPVGDPVWRPVDFHLYSAAIGGVDNGFAEFFAMGGRLLPPPEHNVLPSNEVVPGTPHTGPYDEELAAGVAANGFVDRHAFPAEAFSTESRNGIYLVWMLVADPGVTGQSPDFASGPIIPNSIFPIEVRGVTTRNGELFDPLLASVDVPPLDENVAPQFAGLDGYSHIPVFLAESQLFGPAGTPVEGRYRFEITLRDQAGNGWDLTAQFVIGTEGRGKPATPGAPQR